jgi:hypothetical protein
MYSVSSWNFASLDIGDNPGDTVLASLDRFTNQQIRDVFRSGFLHVVILTSFDNFKEAEARGEKLRNFDINTYFSLLESPTVDNDLTAGYFWSEKPLLGPDHWRYVHVCFTERLSESNLFCDGDPDEGDNANRKLSLQKFMTVCFKAAEVIPPVPKRAIHDVSPDRVDVWFFAALSEVARASRFGEMKSFLESISYKLESTPQRVLGDISLLLRLAPEAFAFFMLVWEIAKERT